MHLAWPACAAVLREGLHHCCDGGHAGGDLAAAIEHDETRELRWYGRGHRIALDIVRGLYFLHSHDVSGRFMVTRLQVEHHARAARRCSRLTSMLLGCHAAAAALRYRSVVLYGDWG